MTARLTEIVARAIWESQRARIGDQDGINAKLAWGSGAAPVCFWDSYRRDAEAAIGAMERFRG